MRNIVLSLVVLPGLAVSALAQSIPTHPVMQVPNQQVVVDDSFWSPKLKVWEEVTVPDSLTKFDNDRGGAINNFDRVRDGKMGHHAGPEWYDGLIYEMIRGTADFLVSHPDPKLQQRIEGYIDRIAAAADRDPQGYIETWTQLEAPKHRWGLNGGNDVQQHELYNAGALVDAGIHWYRATGQTKLLQVGVRMANIMCDLMGPAPKVNQVPGHSLGEEALLNLYLLFREQPELKSKLTVPVNEQNYLELAQFWIDNRGNHTGRSLNWGAYAQDDKPLAQQQEMEGHAVRDGLFVTGVAAAAKVTGREDYKAAAQRLWNNMDDYKIYITGGLGAGLGIEGFGGNYYLPNKTAYAETCAAAAGGFFDLNMNLMFGDAKYADALERELFNGALSGVSLKGDTYFYENPLETEQPHERWEWNGCPCCPPMFLKLMGALPSYIYAQETNAIYVNQFIGSKASVTLKSTPVTVQQTTHYPWDGEVKITITPEKAREFDLYIRIPAWCQGATASDDLYTIVGRPETGAAKLKLNGRAIEKLDIVRGYAHLHRRWKAGDEVELSFDMPVRQVKANPGVEADRGMVALMRGPMVYCAETIDNPSGFNSLVVGPDATFKMDFEPDLLGGVPVLHGQVQTSEIQGGATVLKPAALTMIPFYANANRSASTLRVWLPADASKAIPVTLAMRSRASASYCWHEDSIEAMHDGVVPAKSSDNSLPRLSYWDHKGTAEWAQLDFPEATQVSKVRVFWYDDLPVNGGCDVPESWSVLYKDGDTWKPVEGAGNYGVTTDEFNDVQFKPVQTTALRLQIQLKPDQSAGISEWQVE